MTISHVQSADAGSNSTSANVAFGSNVTNGNLIVVYGSQVHTGGTKNFVAGDCTNSGTATLDTFVMDREHAIDAVEGKIHNAIWSALVTDTGTCTITVTDGGGANNGTSLQIAEFSTTQTWDATRYESGNESGNADNADTTAETGTATSAGAAVFVAGVNTFSVAGVTITQNVDFTEIGLTRASGGGGTHDSEADYRIVTSGTTDEGTWTLGSGNLGWISNMAIYKEAAVSGSNPNLLTLLGVG